MNGIQVFVSFDIEHDRELYDQLRSQADSVGFSIAGGSERVPGGDVTSEAAQRRIRDADQVIVICGEHTEGSMSVSAELRFAQQEQVPYFLLWGRRELMCTKPVGARPADGMYGWTRQTLQDQIASTSRKARSDAMAESLRNPPRKA